MKINSILNKLNKDIDDLVEKYGMTNRIEAVNEEWIDLMYAYFARS
jgi:hypothetical protein